MKIILRVLQSSDDALENAGSVSLTGTLNIQDADDYGGLRFQNLPIPAGATINSANLRFSITSTAQDDPDLSVYCEAADDATTFTTGASDISNRTLTTAFTDWDVTGVGANWMADGERVDITEAVQEVIDRAGWAQGNALNVILKGNAACDVEIRSWDTAVYYSPVLEIDYDYDNEQTSTQASFEDTAGTITLGGTALPVGSGAKADLDEYLAFRFTGIKINQGTVVNAAAFQLQWSGSRTGGNGNLHITLWAEDADDSAALTTTTDDISNRTVTTANVAMDSGGILYGTNATNGPPDDKHAIDVTDLVQEVVDRGTFAGGNDLTIIIQAEENGTLQSIGTAELAYDVAADQETVVTHYEEGATQSDVTSTYTTVHTFEYQPNDDKDYVTLFAWGMDITAFAIRNGFHKIVDVDGSQDIAEQMNDPYAVGANQSGMAMDIKSFATSPALQTYQIQHKLSTTFSSQAVETVSPRMLAIELGDDDQTAESNGESTTTAGTYQDKVTKTWTPSSTGDYLIIAFAEITNSSTSGNTFATMDIDGTEYGEGSMEPRTANYYKGWMHMQKINLDNTSHTIKIKYYDGASTAKIRNARIVAIRLDRFVNEYHDDTAVTTETRTTESTATYTVKNNLAESFEIRKHIAIGLTKMDNQVATNRGFFWKGEFNDTAHYEANQSSVEDTNDAYSNFFIHSATLITGDEYELEFRASSNGSAAGASWSRLTVLQTNEALPTGTEVNDARSAEITGSIDVDDARSAEIHGQQAANDARNAEISGVDTTNDTRSAEIHGNQSDNDTRSAQITGTADANDNRSAEMHGVATDNDTRSAEITGKIDVNDARSAEINGQQTSVDNRSAELHGTATDNDARNAEITGQESANDNRSAEIHGQANAVDNRSAEIHGVATDSDNRNAEISGTNAANDSRSAEIHGQQTANDSRSAQITGQDTANDNRSAQIHGQASANDNRGAEIHGQNTANDSRNAEITGQQSANDSRNAELHGIATDNDTRNAEVHGTDTTNDARNAEITGSQVDNDVRSAQIHGIDTANDTRSAQIHGTDTANTSRSAEINGIDTTNDSRASEIHGQATDQDARSAELTGAQDVSDNRSAEVHGVATDNSSRSAQIEGSGDVSDTRNAELTGSALATDDRNAEIHGIVTTTDDRNAEIHGQDTANDDRNAEIHGSQGVADARNAELHGIDTDNSSRASEITGSLAVSDTRPAETSGQQPAADARSAQIDGENANISTRNAEITGKLDSNTNRSAEINGVATANSSRGAEMTGGVKDPYCPQDSPYTEQANPYTNQSSPYTSQSSPYSDQDSPYSGPASADCD